MSTILVILIQRRQQSLVLDFWLVTHSELSLVPLSTKLTVGLLSH
jgi:hypothetical protein